MKRKIIHILLYVLLALVLVVMLSWIALQFSSVQSKMTDYALHTFSERYKAELRIGQVDVDFFRTVRLSDVYVEDQQQDTLAYIGTLEAKISLFSLWRKKLSVSSVHISDARIDIHNEAGVPNYNFLLSAPDNKPTSEMSSTPWEWNLSTIVLDGVDVSYQDSIVDLDSAIEWATIDVKEIDVGRQKFSLSKAAIRGLDMDIALLPYETTHTASFFPILPFALSIESLQAADSRLRIAHKGYSSTKSGFDDRDIDVRWKSLRARDLHFDDNGVRSTISLTDAHERGGLEVERLASHFVLSDTLLQIEQLDIATPASRIRAEGSCTYETWEKWMDAPLSSTTMLTCDKSYIGRRDIDYFHRYLPKGIGYEPIQKVYVHGSVQLKNKRLRTEGLQLDVSEVGKLTLDLDASAIDRLDAMKLRYNVSTGQLHLAHLRSMFPAWSIPPLVDSLHTLRVAAIGYGSLSTMQLDTLVLDAGKKLSVSTKGRIEHLDDVGRLRYALSKVDIDLDTRWIPMDSSVVKYQEKLHHLAYRGMLSGSLTDWDVDGHIQTPIGSSTLDVSIQSDTSYTSASYAGRIKLEDFLLDALLDSKQYGRTSLTLDIDGSGLTQESLNLAIKGDVHDVTYNYHGYKNIGIDGTIRGLSYEGVVVSKEDGTRLRYNGLLDFNRASSAYKTEILLDSMDLYRLNMVERPFTISGSIKTDLTGADYAALEGSIRWSDIHLIDAKASYTYKEDAILTIKNDERLGKVVTIRSPFLDTDAHADIAPEALLPAIVQHLYPHLPMGLVVGDSLVQNSAEYAETEVQISAKLKEVNPFFGAFSEDDIYIKGGVIDLSLSSVRNRLEVDVRLDSAHFNTYAIGAASLDLQGDEAKVESSTSIKRLYHNGKELFPDVQLDGSGKQQVLELVLDAKDEDHVPRIMMGSTITDVDGDPYIQVHDSLVINKERWFVSKNNHIRLADKILEAENLEIFRNNQSVRLETVQDAKTVGVLLTVDKFRIDEINKILSREEKSLNGKINGSIRAHDLYGNPYITSDLKVEDIIYNDKPVGNLGLTAKQDKAQNNVLFDFDLVGKQNDALGQMTYNIDKSSFDGFLEVAQLEMRLVDPFVRDIIEESTGHIYGDFKILGTLSKPDISGNLLFDDASTVIKASKTRYHISDQKVRFNKRTIQFDGVRFTDIEGRSAIVQGNIRHRNFSDFYISLEANAEGMQVLNTTAQDNAFLYGKIYLDTDINIYGAPDKLKVEGFATAVNNSELFMSPFSDTETLSTDDFIIFSPPKDLENDSIVIEYARDEKFPVDVDVSLAIEEDTKFHFIVNPVTGDKLQAQGNADLQISLKKDGDINLFGNYIAEKGFYLFSYGPIQREFDLVKGGTVTFDGDPLAAKLDIKALYDADVAPYELLKSEVSEESKYKYTQRMDVQVELGLSGRILSPEIKLDIKNASKRTDEISKALDQKLASIRTNPNELNNQVFGLLMLETFISVDNTISGYGAENIILGSVSSLISSQLNNLTKGIEEVNISFDVQNYSKESQTGGTDLVTEMNVGVSRSLFNDRITIRAGGNFDLESGSGDSKFSRIAGDFVIEWRLNEEGNYIVKIFNRSDYNRVDENQNKTGVSFSVKKNLD